MSGDNAEGALILVVEDFDDSRQLLAMSLRQEGYRIVEASNGGEALEAAQRERPDLVLMDLSLPVMDGLSAVYRIREQESMSGVPIVACTAHSPELHMRAACAVGCDEYITKPVDFTRLKEIVRRLLNEGRDHRAKDSARAPQRMDSEELTSYIDSLLAESDAAR